MKPCGSTLGEQLSSIMDVLTKAAVSEISQLFSEGSATLHLQITRSLKENETLRTKMKVMRSELFTLRLQTRPNASRASRLALSRANICKPGTPSMGNDCDDFGDRSTHHVTPESLHGDAPGSSRMSSHREELRILNVYGNGEGPLAVDCHGTLFTVSEVEALSSLSADHSVAKSLECGERLVRLEELTGQQTPDPILIKEEKDIGGGMPPVEALDYVGDRSTQRGGTSDSLHVDAPGSSNMSSHNGRTHTDEKPYVCGQCMRRFKMKGNMQQHMMTHSGEKPYRCDQCVKRFSQKCYLKRHMRTHSREKPHRCDQCVKCFNRSYNLKIHMRTHSGEKPYRCDQCVKCFSQNNTLMIHMRTHSGEKPHRCDQCVKRFVRSSELKCHMRTHSREKPCVCLQCNANFSNQSKLRLHMRKHTAIDTGQRDALGDTAILYSLK
ncbi:unnamed protein product [Boreogadus saida]